MSFIGSFQGGYLAVGVITLGGVLVRRGMVRVRRWRQSLEAAKPAVGQPHDAPVATSGTVSRDRVVTSPFQGVDCVMFQYSIKQIRAVPDGGGQFEVGGSGRHSRKTEWTTVASGSSDAPFFIDDGDTRVCVRPSAVILILKSCRGFRLGWEQGTTIQATSTRLS